MTQNSSAAHVEEWIKDYIARQQAAISRRPKPEGIDDAPQMTGLF
jgi:hypothetical protein